MLCNPLLMLSGLGGWRAEGQNGASCVSLSIGQKDDAIRCLCKSRKIIKNNYLPEALWKKLLENSMDFRESDRLRPGMQKTFAWAHCSCGGAQKECL